MMVRTRLLGVLSAMVSISLLAFPTVAQASAPPFPDSMAAIGDSITQAADVCCFYGDHPAHSWSTGDDGADVVLSHYERILASNPAIAGNEHNDAVSGAKMADAAAQATIAVSQQPGYVTILMGANDVCTSSIDTMTPTDTFQTQFEAAMATLEAGLPAGSHIFVASVPNIYRLWRVLHTNALAQAFWYAAQICQSMLSPSNTKADRLTVLAQEKADNAVLQQVCSTYSNCLFDRYAAFHFAFTAGDVSTLDYFHPSLAGQAALAEVTWAASWWG